MTDATRYEKGQDNITALAMDMPGQSASTMNSVYREAMAKTIARLEVEKEGITGVVLTPAKKTFFAGNDLSELIEVTKADAPVFYQGVFELKGQLRRLETLDKPVVAAINGTTLGGGWEICLAYYHHIALGNLGMQLGLLEVTLSLLPGGGGVVHMVCLLGLEKALPYLAEGKKVRPAEALKAGLIHELTDSPEEVLEETRARIPASPAAKQPQDSAGYKIPGGTPASPNVAQMLAIAPSMLRDKTKGCFSAPKKIMCAVMEDAQADLNTARSVEARCFTELTTGQVAENMIGTLWLQPNEINAGKSRPQGYPVRATKKAGVIGAGMMGAGIAYISAAAGTEVVLKDVSLEAAERGKVYLVRLLDEKVAHGHLSAEKHDASLARIMPNVNEADFEGYGLIIEAIFEGRALKGKVTVEAEKHALADAVMASNTSTLPVTGLVQAVVRPEKPIGPCFFSPVDKMPLVGIIRGEETSDEALAYGFDYVLQIKKTPIVINDNRGFFASRILDTFINKGIAILDEGVSTVMIGNQARQVGMPVGPLAIFGEVSLSLMTHVRSQAVRDLEVEDKALPTRLTFVMTDLMVNEYKRLGEAANAGFYDYPVNGRKHLRAEPKSRFEEPNTQTSAEDVHDRLLFIRTIETVRYVEEGVLHSTADVDIGLVFGIGFTARSGDVLQFINQHGLRDFITRTQYLVEQCGERFEPPTLLLERTAKGELF